MAQTSTLTSATSDPYYLYTVDLPALLPTASDIESDHCLFNTLDLQWRKTGMLETLLPQSSSLTIPSAPYYAPVVDLPAPLPTTAEIESSGEYMRDETYATKVVAVGPHFVAKYGKWLNLEEGRMMMFIRQQTRVPVPRVYALYHDNGHNFIVMERIHGHTLKETWDTFDDPKKREIITHLKEYLREIRNVESPAAYCSLDKGPLLHSIFRPSNNFCDNGPFDTEAEFNDAMIRKCCASEALNNKGEFYQRVLPQVLHGHAPVLTHGDIQKKNIMIRPGPTVDIVLLDWESAGWYPTYWEYSNTIFASWFENDWYRWVDDFLEPFPHEYAWFAMLEQEIGW
ncbi:hypothetical protein A1O3_06110 [Capronia epimyces CBS 606.96]|uniref:Aminoglycoside phosphotransferase domain-containing protein n=1 Tax=Capronia epimyces CBS 606.96 TaxID=1182542 RepID=W9XP25_9EURO|nr:uncharacterized protein A1O3_06110 [Capronia epimyces CBS 606.96]EXJ82297.1 hypothetical protein A1O3_06110 [Capronia epimyces CBS 606.96]